MGIARDFPTAFAKAQAAAGAAAARRRHRLHHRHRLRQARGGRHRADPPRPRLPHRRHARHQGGASSAWASRPTELKKIGEGSPNVVDWIESGDVDLVVNTPTGSGARTDGWEIRRAADRPRDPVPDDALRRAGGRARDRRRAPGRRGGALAAGDPRRARAGRGRRVTAAEPRTLAPFGRRTLRSPSAASVGAYVVLAAEDPDGPAPRAGQFYMLAAAQRWGGGARGAPVPAARASASCARATTVLEFMLEAVGPGTERLCELGPGDGLHVTGPLGHRLRRAAATAAARCCAAAASAPRRWRSGRTSCSRAASRRRRCWASATPTTRRAPTLLHNARVATDDGSHGHHGLVTDLLAEELDDGRPGRRLRLRPAADARGGARAVRGARGALPARAGVRAWPAASAPASAASSPLRDGGYLRAVRRRPGPRRRAARHAAWRGALTADRLLRPAPRPPDRQRLGHLRRDRGAARVRRRAARALPVRGLRLQDDHAGAARRQPAAAALRDPGRADQLDRPAQQGAARLPRPRPARARARCRCR